MAASFGSDTKALTGTTPVIFMPDPGAGSTNECLVAAIWNRDTAQRTVKATIVGGTVTPFELGTVTLAAGARGVIPGAVGAVVTNGLTLKLESDSAAATTEPAAHVSWFNVV